MFRVSPHVSIEPGELVSGHAPEGEPEDIFVGIKNGELVKKLLGLLSGLGVLQQGSIGYKDFFVVAATNSTRA